MLSPCHPDPRLKIQWPLLRPRNIKWTPNPSPPAPHRAPSAQPCTARSPAPRRAPPCLLRSSAPRLPHSPKPRPSAQPVALHSALFPQIHIALVHIQQGRHGTGGGSCSGGEREPRSWRQRRQVLDDCSCAVRYFVPWPPRRDQALPMATDARAPQRVLLPITSLRSNIKSNQYRCRCCLAPLLFECGFVHW